jgi:glycosyltransferase involved in cell wall biosynthesis
MPSADQPRVAVVIPCFDDGATVEEAVRSATAEQEPVELAVVDDGSTDPATLEALARLERGGVHVLRQANAGVSAARMAGLAATSAAYVLPLDADDVLEPGAIALLADRLDADPALAAAWGWYQRFGDESTLQPTAPALDPWHVSHQNELPASALLRRSALAETPGWRLHGDFEDWDLWMSLAERGWRGVGIPQVVYHYRREGTRGAHRAAARHAEIVAELRELHPHLFAARRRNWRSSSAPLALRLALPLIERLPIGHHRRRLLAGAASHLAHRRGVALLVRRVREQGAAQGRA